jgi:uncharacterized repeat protein (TIGR01451 family)
MSDITAGLGKFGIGRQSIARWITGVVLICAAAPAWAAVDLVVNNTDTGYDPVAAGGVVQYTVRIDNNGSTAATGVTLSDTLPSGVDFVSSSSTQGSCSAPAGGVVSCAIGDLASLGSATVELRLRTRAAGLITNTATANSTEPDTDSSNNTNITQQTTVTQGADLALSVTPSATSVSSGGALSYSFSVTNNGPDTASAIQVSANLPPGFNATGSLPSGCGVSSQTLTCNLSSTLANGAAANIGPVNGTVSAAGGSTLTLSSSVSITSSSAPQDPVSSNNTVTANVQVTPGSDVRLSKTASVSSPVLVGSTFNYVLSSYYTGDNPTNLSISDTVPSNFQILNAASFTSNGWSCTVSGQTVGCSRAQGGSAAGNNVAIGSITLDVRAVSPGNGVVNTASVSSSTSDPNPSNNNGQVSLNVVEPTADLSASKAGPNPALASTGSNWTWTVSMRNSGPAALTGTARLVDTVPVGITVQAYTATNDWSCAPAAPFTAASGNQTITCTREYTAASPLAAGAWTPQIEYEVGAANAANYVNSVCASSAASANGTPPPDGNSANDCASHSMTVQAAADSADLSLNKTASPATVAAGDVLTYTLEIVNTGPQTSNDVTLSDTLDTLINSGAGPTGQGFIDATISAGNSTGGSCTSTASGSTARDLSCSFTSAPVCTAGSNCPVVTVRVRPGGDGGSRTNTASVVSATVADPVGSNNSASAKNTVDPRADVTVSKSASPSSGVAGQNLTYVVTARNNGPSRAQTVGIIDTLPLDVTFVSATASGGGSCGTQPTAGSTTTTSSRTLACSWSSIGNAAQQTVTVVVRPNTATRGTTLTNRVSVSTATTETDTTNNSASVDVPVANPVLDLLANVVDNPDPVAVGDSMVYTYTVTNNGPSYAENVQISAVLPSARLSYQAVTAPSGVTCTAPSVGSYSGAVACAMGGLAAGSSRSVTVQLLATAKGTTTTQLTVSSDETNAGYDSLPANNTVTEQTTVRNKADVAVTSKTASAATVGLREAFSYSISVANNGAGTADAVVLQDTLPTGMVLTGVPTAAVGNTADFPSLPATPCTGNAGASAFSCTFGDDVANGATATVTVPVKVVTPPSTNPGTLTNTASITTSSKDEVPGNNSASGAVQVQTASLAGSVYADNNDNGVRDAGESGIGSVTVRLTGSAPDGSTVNVSTTTAADGSYSFTGLPAGTYTLTETQPSGWFDGKDTAGSAAGTVAVPPADQISNIVLASNTAATGYLFGELPQSSIAGRVYRDLNNDGVIQGGETGIAGVTMTLSGTDDQGQTVNLTQVTDASGNYAFTGLRPGSYSLSETQPTAFLPGKATAGTGVTAPGAAAASGNAISAINLGLGQTGTGFNFGELPPASLSGLVYVDANRNGVHDASETAGIDGVTLTLTGTDDLGAAVSLTTQSAADGSYQFASLRPGTYTVTETQPTQWTDGGDQAGTVNGSPRGTAGNDTISGITLGAGEGAVQYDFGEIGQGLAGFVYVDLQGNGVRDAGDPGIAGVTVTATNTATGVVSTQTTDSTGAYLFSDLPAGTYNLVETQPAGYADGSDQPGSLGGTASGPDSLQGINLGVNQVGTNYNFGEVGAQLAGSVFIDGNANANGVRDPGEAGIAGVTVTLSGVDLNGAAVTRSAVTDASGAYAFTNLLPSNAAGYTLTEAQPDAYADGAEQVGSLGGTAGAAGSSVISGIVMAAGQSGTGYNFGERTGVLTGVVYADTNNDGVRDAGEPGLGGAVLQLTGRDVNGNAVDLRATTAADGSYVFSGLSKADAAGYTLVETQPTSYLDGKTTPGLIDGATCTACVSTQPNQIGAIPFDPAQVFTAFNFGEIAPASLSGRAFDDVNGNGVFDAGEGLANVTLTLTGTDDRGQPVSLTVVTDAQGAYQFTGLRPGTYTVTETQPAGLADVGVRAGNAGGATTTNQVSSIVLTPGTAAAGYDFLDHGAMLAGKVFLDRNANGAADAGEPGIGGVTVTLSGAQSRTVVTAADGTYQFTGLVAGSYNLTETQPVLYQDGGSLPGNVGGAAGTNAITGIALAAGAAATGYDFAERTGAVGAITGSVWLNQPGGGENRQDASEPGLAGWIVTLYQNGQPVSGVNPARTDANGRYTLADVPAGSGYDLRFQSPSGAYYGYPVSQDANPQWNGSVDPTAAIPAISGITVGSGVTVTQQDLPIDPSGVVYDSVTRQTVPGAVVTLLGPNGQPVDPQYLVGGSANVSQTTAADGFYQFLLMPSAPAGTYQLQIQPPAGYLPPPSSIHPPTGAVLTVPQGNAPYVVSPLSGPPASGTLPPYYLAFGLAPGSAGVVGNHVPLDPVLQGALSVRKTTPKVNVVKAELVPYTITLTNTLGAALSNITVRDQVPPGFKYRSGSARIDGVPVEPVISGRDLSWPGQSFAPNQVRSVQLVLVVGSGVGEGEYVNQAWAINAQANRPVSNIGTAAVRIVPDPTFDCADLIGKVFDDRNANGVQDAGEPGLPGIRLATPRGLLVTTDAQGRYHVPCAAMPQQARGANFVMKLDTRTLPTGYRLTTENPGDVRVTAGKMVKLNFGATIHRVVRISVNAAAFAAQGDALQPSWTAELAKVQAQLRERPSVVRLAYRLSPGESPGLAQQRLDALRERIEKDWSQLGRAYPLAIETEIVEVQP